MWRNNIKGRVRQYNTYYFHLYVRQAWNDQNSEKYFLVQDLLSLRHRKLVWNIQENYILCDVYECEFKLVAEEKLLIWSWGIFLTWGCSSPLFSACHILKLVRRYELRITTIDWREREESLKWKHTTCSKSSKTG